MAGRTTEAWKWFMGELVALEPRTENSGTYANKAGYHNSRENLQSNPSWDDDYSIRASVDKEGPSDASAAGDWTFHDAQSGNYNSIMKYMDRIEAAFKAKDPRLKTWREVLGQSDTDTKAEGYDFDSWSTRTPDSSHTWHIHFSEHRKYAEDYDSKNAMLSILRGDDMSQETEAAISAMLTNYTGSGIGPNAWLPIKIEKEIQPALTRMETMLSSMVQREADLLAAIKALSGSSGNVDVETIKKHIDSRTADVTGKIGQLERENADLKSSLARLEEYARANLSEAELSELGIN